MENFNPLALGGLEGILQKCTNEPETDFNLLMPHICAHCTANVTPTEENGDAFGVFRYVLSACSCTALPNYEKTTDKTGKTRQILVWKKEILKPSLTEIEKCVEMFASGAEPVKDTVLKTCIMLNTFYEERGG